MNWDTDIRVEPLWSRFHVVVTSEVHRGRVVVEEDMQIVQRKRLRNVERNTLVVIVHDMRRNVPNMFGDICRPKVLCRAEVYQRRIVQHILWYFLEYSPFIYSISTL